MMKETNRLIRRRRFYRRSDRKLSARDLSVLDFLWTWKVASTPVLKEFAFREKSDWWVYKALRQLKFEHYIQTLPRGKFIEQELWALTDLGFEVVLMDRDDIVQYRYRPHAPSHDYLATCLQMGECWLSRDPEREFFTEQMLASFSPSNFPRSFRKFEEHVPDGMTFFRNGGREALVGYEVDLNLKADERYRHTLNYYTQGVGAHLIVWLVKSPWVADRIVRSLGEGGPFQEDRDRFLSKVAFVTLDDFKARVYEAETFRGKLKGISLRKLHANLLQSIGKQPPKIPQRDMRQLYFSRFKSPQKLGTYPLAVSVQDSQHPSGPGDYVSFHSGLPLEVLNHE